MSDDLRTRIAQAWKSLLDPDWKVYESLGRCQPHCDDCGRVIVVGSATKDYWRCNYCQTVRDF